MGDIRLCIDMRRVNEAVVRERYPFPTVDETLQQLNGSSVFSKLDLRAGFHQIELTEEARNYTGLRHTRWSLQIQAHDVRLVLCTRAVSTHHPAGPQRLRGVCEHRR